MTTNPHRGTSSSSANPEVSDTHPTRPMPHEPEDVDSLLAETLRAESEEDFAWKEPERRPRWYERLEQQSPAAAASTTAVSGVAPATGRGTGARRGGPRIGQLLLGVACLLLAVWCLAALVLGVVLDPLLVALGLCTLGGLALVVSGLRPRRRRRL